MKLENVPLGNCIEKIWYKNLFQFSQLMLYALCFLKYGENIKIIKKHSWFVYITNHSQSNPSCQFINISTLNFLHTLYFVRHPMFWNYKIRRRRSTIFTKPLHSFHRDKEKILTSCSCLWKTCLNGRRFFFVIDCLCKEWLDIVNIKNIKMTQLLWRMVSLQG